MGKYKFYWTINSTPIVHEIGKNHAYNRNFPSFPWQLTICRCFITNNFQYTWKNLPYKFLGFVFRKPGSLLQNYGRLDISNILHSPEDTKFSNTLFLFSHLYVDKYTLLSVFLWNPSMSILIHARFSLDYFCEAQLLSVFVLLTSWEHIFKWKKMNKTKTNISWGYW